MTQATLSPMEKRKKRAEDRYLRLAYPDVDTKVVQKRVNDDPDNPEWGDAHILKTENGDAFECSCPDCQKNGHKCYHQHAWDMMSFDEIVFTTGEVVQL